MNSLAKQKQSAFTIVELLIVIVVIAILSVISILVYNGIQDRAKESAVKSDLAGASKQLAIDRTISGSYPSDTSSANQGGGLPSSDGTTYQYTVDNTGSGSFCLSAVNDNQAYYIENNGTPQEGVCPGHEGPGGEGGGEPTTGITIGSQTWAESNLNVGTMVTGSTAQIDNSTVEKYCYNDDEANCSTYGALYQWNEAMQYTTSEGAQGICPAGWHIPSDNDWKMLEMELGMSQAQADATGWRGTDQSTQLKAGGSSGLDVPLAGYYISGSSGNLDSFANVWSSSESGGSAWRRYLYSGIGTVNRTTFAKTYGFSVRCIEN